ncbi:hypothetical protein [Arachnia propionica]|uniref:Uncharacterized protein n=1 Tax=Arachnia propionica TaxID=1750 RepID=A0A3P1WRP7_9ACTN|nr:hypothetical protein [Arachnia propionica]RRD48518.1 hypothetical protein EII35_12340 [Arachnia propionica]
MRPEVVEIPASTPMKRLGRHTLVVFQDRSVVLRREGSDFRCFSSDEGEPELLPPVRKGRRVGDVICLAELQHPLRFASLPDGEVVHEALGPLHNLRRHSVPSLLRGAALTLLVVGLVVFVTHSAFGPWGVTLVSLPMTLILGGMVLELFIGKTFMFRTGGRNWAFTDLLVDESRGEIALRQVQGVKEEYGRLLTDLPYRVENPALFDASCPTTEALTLALFEWDSTWARLDDDALVALSSRVVGAFHAARHHAERVGMDHLPPGAREDARRAVGALRLAAAASSAGERTAALKQAIDLLDDLALHYLPTGAETREVLNGRQVLQLPGRRAM